MNNNHSLVRKKGFSLGWFSTYRAQLFGIATVMVVLFHSYISIANLLPNTPVLAQILSTARSHCNKGVEMFLFMSGIGLYYSLSGNPSLKNYYRNRAVRILPAVMTVSLIWFAMNNPDGVASYLKNAFFISFFTDGTRIFWYFILIIILYAVYPLIHKLYEKTGAMGYITSIIVVVALNMMFMELDPIHYGNIEIAITRIPVFLTGAWLGKHVKNGTTISYLWVLLAAVLTVAIFIFYYKMPLPEANYLYVYRYVGGFYGLSLLFLWTALMSKTTLGFVGTFFVWIGAYSMEIYLVHEKVSALMSSKFHTNDPSMVVYYTAIFFIALMYAMALKAFCSNLEKNLFLKNAKKPQPTEKKLQEKETVNK